MTIGQKAMATLEAWGAFTDDRRTLSVTEGDLSITAHVLEADKLSCALSAFTLQCRPSGTLDSDALRAWSERIGARVRYLLESLEMVELDSAGGRLLLRSTPPERKPDGSVYYYEMMLEAAGHMMLERFRFDPASRDRCGEPMRCTRELLHKLIDDLAGTTPD